ncbi:MAG: four helix bundle protein [Patescibacteria group bacterium]|jgi:four helix bundle protein
MAIDDNPIYNRSCDFAKATIAILRTIHQDPITRPLISQLVRSSTSIGANLSEATFGTSRKDFISKVTIALKEAHESLYWLDLLESSNYIDTSQANQLKNEAREIRKILATIKLKTAEKAVP